MRGLPLLAPLLSLFILILGNAFFITYVAVRLNLEDVPTWLIGAMSAVYYAGVTLASFRLEPFIIRVGHIRAYAVFAAGTCSLILLQVFYINPWWWLPLRFLNGCCLAGIFVAIESWLLAGGSRSTRGQLLSLYMIALYAAQSFGQFFLNINEIQNDMAFLVAALLTTLSIIPVAMTRAPVPRFEVPSALTPKALYRLSALGVLGCICSGLMLGAIYGLLPLYIQEREQTTEHIGLLMSLTILGGALFQYPIGKLSDLWERQYILLLISLVAFFLCCIMMIKPLSTHRLFLEWVFFIFGGLAFTIYPLCINHTCDYTTQKDTIAATQGLLLIYSVGASIGPLVGAFFMDMFSNDGLFIFFAADIAILICCIFWQKLSYTGTPPAPKDFKIVPRTTPLSSELSQSIKK